MRDGGQTLILSPLHVYRWGLGYRPSSSSDTCKPRRRRSYPRHLIIAPRRWTESCEHSCKYLQCCFMERAVGCFFQDRPHRHRHIECGSKRRVRLLCGYIRWRRAPRRAKIQRIVGQLPCRVEFRQIELIRLQKTRAWWQHRHHVQRNRTEPGTKSSSLLGSQMRSLRPRPGPSIHHPPHARRHHQHRRARRHNHPSSPRQSRSAHHSCRGARLQRGTRRSGPRLFGDCHSNQPDRIIRSRHSRDGECEGQVEWKGYFDSG